MVVTPRCSHCKHTAGEHVFTAHRDGPGGVVCKCRICDCEHPSGLSRSQLAGLLVDVITGLKEQQKEPEQEQEPVADNPKVGNNIQKKPKSDKPRTTTASTRARAKPKSKPKPRATTTKPRPVPQPIPYDPGQRERTRQARSKKTTEFNLTKRKYKRRSEFASESEKKKYNERADYARDYATRKRKDPAWWEHKLVIQREWYKRNAKRVAEKEKEKMRLDPKYAADKRARNRAYQQKYLVTMKKDPMLVARNKAVKAKWARDNRARLNKNYMVYYGKHHDEIRETQNAHHRARYAKSHPGSVAYNKSKKGTQGTQGTQGKKGNDSSTGKVSKASKKSKKRAGGKA